MKRNFMFVVAILALSVISIGVVSITQQIAFKNEKVNLRELKEQAIDEVIEHEIKFMKKHPAMS